MSSAVQPAISVVSVIKDSIVSIVNTNLPADVRIKMIIPLLIQINQWSTQIPALVNLSGPPVHMHLLFAIRKELFIAPQFTKCHLGYSDALPASFLDFLSLINNIIQVRHDTQKAEKTKNSKVCPFFSCYSLFVVLISRFNQASWKDY